MKIGIPKEVKQEKYRVSLQPKNLALLISQGHIVYVQASAGKGSDYTDEDYKVAGAAILQGAKEVFENSQG